jgi:hypothetical protein
VVTGAAGAGAFEAVIVRCVESVPAGAFELAVGWDSGACPIEAAGSLAGAGAITGFTCRANASSKRAARSSTNMGDLTADGDLTMPFNLTLRRSAVVSRVLLVRHGL